MGMGLNNKQYFIPIVTKETKFNLFSAIKYFFGIREELTYKERIAWFLYNYYETGMEYPILLKTMLSEDLDNLKWYNDYIKIPKYCDELN